MKGRTFLVALLICTTLYFLFTVSRVNTLLVGTSVGFVYQPLEDSLFKVTLRPSVHSSKQVLSQILNPFQPIFYERIAYVEPLGKLEMILTERDHPEITIQKMQADIDRQLAEGFEFFDILFYPRVDLQTKDLWPKELKGLQKYSERTPGIHAGDAVFVKWHERGGNIESRVLDRCIFIGNPEAAHEIEELIGE